MKASRFVVVLRNQNRITIPDINLKVIRKKFGLTSLEGAAVVFKIEKIILDDGKTIDLNNVT